jgi:hypothetical protein
MNEHEGVARVRALLSPEQLATIKNLRWKDRRHPLQRLLFPQDRDEQFVYNTGVALSAIFNKDGRWLLAKKKHFLSLDSYNDPSSVLGEVRAYGSLLRCGLTVKPGSEGLTSEPDFVVGVKYLWRCMPNNLSLKRPLHWSVIMPPDLAPHPQKGFR